MNDTVDKFHLRPHFRLNVEVLSACWVQDYKSGKDQAGSSYWSIDLRDKDHCWTVQAKVFISAVGALSVPKEMDMEGLEDFRGRYWHSAKWDLSYDWRGKDVALIGNGCSASQIVPELLADGVGSIVQFGQSAQWYVERTNQNYSALQQMLFRYVPGWLSIYRFYLFYKTDAESITYETTPRGRKYAEALEQKSRQYVHKMAPKDVADSLIPSDMLGCKRRVLDGTRKGSYLASLKHPNMTLVTRRAAKVSKDSVVAMDGTTFKVDAICFATGYKVTDFLVPMTIVGRKGIKLQDVWTKGEGAYAYQTVSVSGFPNFAMLFGPNSFPSNNSVIFKAETQVEYIERLILRPLLVEKRCQVLDVKRDVESRWVKDIRHRLSKMVWSSGCANWYLNKWGHNTSNFPACGLAFRRSLLLASIDDYDAFGKSEWWYAYRLRDAIVFALFIWPLATFCLVGDKLEKLVPLM